MKHVFLLAFSIILIHKTQSQTCASSYDNAFNNSHTPTHYFPGPFAIPLNTDINGRIEAANDIDYYKFFITTGGTITLTLRNLPANYNLNLVNSSGRSIATSARSGTSSETIHFTATSNTEYFALVYPANSRTFNSGSCYTLRVSTGTAARVSALSFDNAVIYPNPARQMVNLRLDDIQGMAQVRVINLLGALVKQQTTTQAVTPINLSGLPGGMYMVDVINAEGNTIYRGKLVKE
jgi:hypothetical protein